MGKYSDAYKSTKEFIQINNEIINEEGFKKIEFMLEIRKQWEKERGKEDVIRDLQPKFDPSSLSSSPTLHLLQRDLRSPISIAGQPLCLLQQP